MLPTDETVMVDPLRRGVEGGEIRGYRIEGVLGRGPLTTVYTGARGGTRFALKAIPLDGAAKPLAEAALREAERLKKLRHEHLATVYEVFSFGTATWIVEDLVAGRPADQFTEGMLGWETAVQCALRAAKALHYMWRFHQLAHGNLKPGNLLLDVHGGLLTSLRLTDAGLHHEGALSGSELILGGALYRAPELIHGTPPDDASDRFALGALLHWLLTGQSPAASEDGGAVRLKSVPSEVATVVATLLRAAPDERYGGWDEVLAALEATLNDNPFEAPATTRVVRPSEPTLPRTNRVLSPATASLRADPIGGWLRERVRDTARIARRTTPREGALEAAPEGLSPGTAVASYQVVECLRATSLIEHYAVDEAILNRRLALKILTPAGMANPIVVDRLATEGVLLGALHHPSFPYVAGRGRWQDREYLAVERVAGADLKAYLVHKGRFGEGQALWAGHELATAMEYAYETCRLVHRDLKPAHLVVSDGSGPEGRRLKITDFSTALFLKPRDKDDFSSAERTLIEDSGAGMAVGTPAYMSPEQVRGEAPAPAMDMYALGALLFHLLAGETPFKAANAMAMMQEHLTSTPPDLAKLAEVTPSTADVVARCLAKHPRDRFPTWKHLRTALESANWATQQAKRRKDRGMTATFTRATPRT